MGRCVGEGHMFGIKERERAEMKIEEWLERNRENGGQVTVDASASCRGGFNFGILDSESYIEGIWVESWEEGIQGVAKIIDGL